MELVHRALKAKCSAIDLDTLVARLIDEIIVDCRYIHLRPCVFLRVLWRESLFGLDGAPALKNVVHWRALLAKVAEPRHEVEKVIFEAGHKFPLGRLRPT